jgi:hypothetical protein
MMTSIAIEAAWPPMLAAILVRLLGGAICILVFAAPPAVEGFLLPVGVVLLLAENVKRTARAMGKGEP